MKKKILLAAILFVCASHLFAYIYWEFDGVQTPSKKCTLFHTINVHEDIKKVKDYNKFFNDCHNDQVKTTIDTMPSENEYQMATIEMVDIYCRNGKHYRVCYSVLTDNFGNTTYYVYVYSSNYDVYYSQSSLNYIPKNLRIMRAEYEQEHYSFNAMKNDFERLKSFYIDKL